MRWQKVRVTREKLDAMLEENDAAIDAARTEMDARRVALERLAPGFDPVADRDAWKAWVPEHWREYNTALIEHWKAIEAHGQLVDRLGVLTVARFAMTEGAPPDLIKYAKKANKRLIKAREAYFDRLRQSGGVALPEDDDAWTAFLLARKQADAAMRQMAETMKAS